MLAVALLALSFLPDRVSVPVGLYTFPEIAERLSTPDSKVELGPELAERAAVMHLEERPQAQEVGLAAKALGLAVEKTNAGLRLVLDPKKVAWERGLQDQYLADLTRLLDAQVSQLKEALELSPERALEMRNRLDTLRGAQNRTAREEAEKHRLESILNDNNEIGQQSKGVTLRLLIDNIGRPDRAALSGGNYFPLTRIDVPSDKARELARVMDPNGNAKFSVRVVAMGTALVATIFRASPDGKTSEIWTGAGGFITGTGRYADQIFLGSPASVPIPNLGLGAEPKAWLAAQRRATAQLSRQEIGEDKVDAGRSDDSLSAVILKWARNKNREVAMELCPADDTHLWSPAATPSGQVSVAQAVANADWLLEDVGGVLTVRDPLRFLRELQLKPLAGFVRLVRASYDAFWPHDQIINPPELFEVPTFAALSEYYRPGWIKPAAIDDAFYIPYAPRYFGVPLLTLRMGHSLTYLFSSLSQTERNLLLRQASGIKAYPLSSFPDAVRRRLLEIMEHEAPAARTVRETDKLFVRWRSTNVPGERVVSLYMGERDFRYVQTIDGRRQEADLAPDLMYPWVFRDRASLP